MKSPFKALSIYIVALLHYKMLKIVHIELFEINRKIVDI